MGQFDQASRPLAKWEEGGWVRWGLSCCDPAPPWKFQRFDDTRRLVCPGEPDRTNDLVALLSEEVEPKREVWLVGEVQEAPQKNIVYRMGEYEILLAKEVNPDCDPEGPLVASLVFNLSGEQRHRRIDWTQNNGVFGSRLAPYIVDVASQDARQTLARIKSGEVDNSVLPLLAVMVGGHTEEFIKQEWMPVALLEKNTKRLVQLRDMAIVLSELGKAPVNWINALEGWLVMESQYIKKWELRGEERGELRRMRADLLKCVKLRLADPVPEAIRAAIEGTNDLEALERWYGDALVASDIAALRKAMRVLV